MLANKNNDKAMNCLRVKPCLIHGDAVKGNSFMFDKQVNGGFQ